MFLMIRNENGTYNLNSSKTHDPIISCIGGGGGGGH